MSRSLGGKDWSPTHRHAEHAPVLQKGSKLPPEEDLKETSRSNRKKCRLVRIPYFFLHFPGQNPRVIKVGEDLQDTRSNHHPTTNPTH